MGIDEKLLENDDEEVQYLTGLDEKIDSFEVEINVN